MFILKVFVLLLLQIASQLVEGQTNIGDACNQGRGTCSEIASCPPVLGQLNNPNYEIPFCSGETESVCCPNPIVPTIGVRFGDIEISENSPIHVIQCNAYQKRVKKCDALPLIVNGKKADPREFPHMAWLGTKTDGLLKHLCGGTLISENYVLTAAHCLAETINHVRLGELDFGMPNDNTQEFGVKKPLEHPEYDWYSRYNDIALIELDRPATLNEYVMPACLASVNGTDYSYFIAAGWGQPGHAKVASTHLLKVNLERFSDDECKNKIQGEDDSSRLFKGLHVNTQICAGSKKDTSDTCQGDSGGPLFIPHDDYQCMFTLIGITSYGFGCGTVGLPGVYTRVNLYIDWIEKIVWKAAVSV